ncbi:hypothetical protein E2C01_025148 [Portunus trituberculatus]|uniref:Uncharacterized protein n=1 Tax=Portunus trituberculatus TaxID=210409 RepID=A0A5B7EEG1_PORTR|nr:hypothetical protein [Portunus trituberculatus]
MNSSHRPIEAILLQEKYYTDNLLLLLLLLKSLYDTVPASGSENCRGAREVSLWGEVLGPRGARMGDVGVLGELTWGVVDCPWPTYCPSMAIRTCRTTSY